MPIRALPGLLLGGCAPPPEPPSALEACVPAHPPEVGRLMEASGPEPELRYAYDEADASELKRLRAAARSIERGEVALGPAGSISGWAGYGPWSVSRIRWEGQLRYELYQSAYDFFDVVRPDGQHVQRLPVERAHSPEGDLLIEVIDLNGDDWPDLQQQDGDTGYNRRTTFWEFDPRDQRFHRVGLLGELHNVGVDE